MGRRHMSLRNPGSLNTVTPCAACKLLRRRCAQECPFSPYFSPHEPQKFASVHKVFGASNVSKLLLEVPESQRADAANSLVYEANVRLRDPVYGCMGAISALQQQIQSLQVELGAVRDEILRYNKYYTTTRKNNNSALSVPTHVGDFVSSGSAVSVINIAPLPLPTPQPQPLQQPTPAPTTSSSSNSMYTPTTSTTTNYSTLSTDNVSYFG
ncbi:LOB domain-containing protein [Heracleum sosnowskyi]|uniref:LOB domain-containing protein n=1 Tax=Heracleum sosnowskyi TaxID=360622 RepID=A0AAD8GLQ0_9APIA|nr:LOB domain-containing protein [Heracleum sosnowskyi]